MLYRERIFLAKNLNKYTVTQITISIAYAIKIILFKSDLK